MHGSAVVLPAVAVGLDSVVRAVVMDHAGSVDAADVQFINQIQTLGLPHSRGSPFAVLVSGTIVPLFAALATPALFLDGERALVDHGGFRVSAAALSPLRAALVGWSRAAFSRSWWSSRRLAVATVLLGARGTTGLHGKGAAALRWDTRGSPLVLVGAVVENEIVLRKGRVISKEKREEVELLHGEVKSRWIMGIRGDTVKKARVVRRHHACGRVCGMQGAGKGLDVQTALQRSCQRSASWGTPSWMPTYRSIASWRPLC